MTEYQSNIQKLAVHFRLSEQQMRKVLKRGCNMGVFSNKRGEINIDEPSILVQVNRALRQGYDLSDQVAAKVADALESDFESLNNGTCVSVQAVADAYNISQKDLSSYLAISKPKKIAYYDKPKFIHITHEQAAKWIRPNPFLSSQEGDSVMYERVPEIISEFLISYLLIEGNKQPLAQWALYNQVKNTTTSNATVSKIASETNDNGAFYLFDKIKFSKNAVNRLSHTEVKKTVNGVIIGFYKNKRSHQVDIIAATSLQKAPIVLVTKEDWDSSPLFRRWSSDVYIRSFMPDEKMVVLDVPVVVNLGGDYDRQLKKIDSDNTVDSILQLNRRNDLSLKMVSTLQLLLFELFVTYHRKHHDEKIPLYIQYDNQGTTDAPNSRKFVIQAGIPAITMRPVRKILEDLKTDFANRFGTNCSKERTYINRLVGDRALKENKE